MIVLIPDLQIPLHDKQFVNALCQFTADHKKRITRVVTMGDELDFTSMGKWSESTPLAYTRKLGSERDQWIKIAEDLQVTDTIRSNHTDRLATGIMRRLPGLLDVPEFELPNFMGLPELDINWHPQGLRLADWILLHGDEAGTSQIAGTTSRNLCTKTGLNVACGHVHRAGIVPHTTSINGRLTRTLWGMEVGHAMDYKKVTYLKTMNWQQAFGVLHPNGRTYSPQLVPVVNKSFIFEEKEYKWR